MNAQYSLTSRCSGLVSLLLAFAIVVAGCTSKPQGAEAWLDPGAAQQALIRYMESHPDCFAGFTQQLRQAAQRIVLSEDGRRAFVGSIVVDRAERTYRFERWSEGTEGRTAINLIWSGRFEVARDGALQVTTPSLTRERWVADH